MDSFGFSNICVGKANSIFHYQRRRKIAALFRLLELILFLGAVSNHIPATFRISGEYFRTLSGVILSPKSVFLIGNVIIVILFMNSGFFSNSNMTDSIGTDGYVKISEKGVSFNEQRKQSSFDVNKTERIRKIERTLSEKITKRVDGEKTGRQLRRSATENYRKVKCPEEEMSGEEFRRTVEAFIARQQRFLREEFPAVISDES